MKARGSRARIVAAILAVALIAGVYAVNRFAFGIPAFLFWRATSGELRGRHRADVNGISIYYETYGDGPPVLVLHGATAFLESMGYQIRGLADDHRVVAVDSRAQGRSTDADVPITYTQMGDDMIKLLDALQLPQVDVVGWSDGGIIGLDMAMKHPERVRRLVAMGANFTPDGVDPKDIHLDEASDDPTGVKPIYELIAPDPSHFPVMIEKVTKMIRTEPNYTVADLGQIRAPTLIIAGEHDAILRPHTDQLAAAIPGSTKVIVPGASHLGPVEQPSVYNELIRDFLNR